MDGLALGGIQERQRRHANIVASPDRAGAGPTAVPTATQRRGQAGLHGNVDDMSGAARLPETPAYVEREDSPLRLRAVPAVTRAFAILRLLGRSTSPLPLKAIAQTLDLYPSTCLHILRALAQEKLVKIDPLKRYGLDVGMLPLARAVLANSSFVTLVQPELDRLSKQYGLNAFGVETRGLEQMVVVARSRSRVPFGLQVEVGSRFPALISATGRCVAAFGKHAWSDIERRFRTLRWQNAPDFDTWRREVETVSRNGYSIDRGNYINGVTIIAVPILDPNGMMSQGIVLLGLTEQIRNRTAIAMAKDMRTAAELVARQMHGH